MIFSPGLKGTDPFSKRGVRKYMYIRSVLTFGNAKLRRQSDLWTSDGYRSRVALNLW